MSDATKGPTVFGIPAPDGRLYRIWWPAYRAARVVRHWLGLHDMRPWGLPPRELRCDWCGKTEVTS